MSLDTHGTNAVGLTSLNAPDDDRFVWGDFDIDLCTRSVYDSWSRRGSFA